MKQYILLLALLALLSVTLSFRWPVEGGRITSTFGESRGDHFHDGIDMISSNPKIYPISAGKLVFFWDKARFPLENYSGAGNYKILIHPNKTYSVYMHLEEGGPVQKSYNAQDTIGYIGNTGHSYGTHIHFAVLDIEKHASYNPIAIMPSVEDKKAPEIIAMHLRIGDKYVQIRENSNIRLTRHYPILLEVYDSISGSERLGVYKLIVHFNEKKVLELQFNKLDFSPQGLVLLKKNFGKVFDEKGYYMVSGIQYLQGENILTVTASDFTGNISEKKFTFNVNLDLQDETK